MAKHKCVVCGKPSINPYCWKHKPQEKKHDGIDDMWELFLLIWRERGPYSELSGKYLGREPKRMFFDHLLEKAVYPEIKHEKWNIVVLSADEHEDKYLCPSSKHTELIQQAKQQYEIWKQSGNSMSS
jgi:hypothetical protein